MKVRVFGALAPLAGLLFLSLFSPTSLLGQDATGTIHGQISDPSGAGVPAAKIAAMSSTGQTRTGTVHSDGTYEINGLAPGVYTVGAKAKGFSNFEQPAVQVAAGKTLKVDVALKIAQEVEKV